MGVGVREAILVDGDDEDKKEPGRERERVRRGEMRRDEVRLLEI